ncbi:MAG: LamG domain-containing protein, partial [Acidobacteriota bacterium]
NGRNGTVAGATWTAAGKSNGALSFDGTNDSVNLPFVLNPSATNFTAAGWIKTDTTAKQIILQQLDGSGTGRAWLYLNNSFLKTHIGGSATASSNTLSTNTWYHIVVVKNGTNIKLYVNGVERASTTRTAESSTGAMKVGASKFSTEWFNGTIDQLRIYDSALSAADISALHNSGQ